MSHLHDYETIQDTAEATIEVCKECKKRNVVRKDKRGRIDNESYRTEHAKDLLQPVGRDAKLFERFYGKYK